MDPRQLIGCVMLVLLVILAGWLLRFLLCCWERYAAWREWRNWRQLACHSDAMKLVLSAVMHAPPSRKGRIDVAGERFCVHPLMWEFPEHFIFCASEQEDPISKLFQSDDDGFRFEEDSRYRIILPLRDLSYVYVELSEPDLPPTSFQYRIGNFAIEYKPIRFMKIAAGLYITRYRWCGPVKPEVDAASSVADDQRDPVFQDLRSLDKEEDEVTEELVQFIEQRGLVFALEQLLNPLDTSLAISFFLHWMGSRIWDDDASGILYFEAMQQLWPRIDNFQRMELLAQIGVCVGHTMVSQLRPWFDDPTSSIEVRHRIAASFASGFEHRTTEKPEIEAMIASIGRYEDPARQRDLERFQQAFGVADKGQVLA